MLRYNFTVFEYYNGEVLTQGYDDYEKAETHFDWAVDYNQGLIKAEIWNHHTFDSVKLWSKEDGIVNK